MIDRAISVFVLRDDGAALLQHRDDKPELRYPGMWGPPGGHAEAGESMVECARRELREETEYDCPDLRYLLVLDDVIEGHPPYRITMFWCRYDGIQPIVCHEGQAVTFIKRSEAKKLPMPVFICDAWDAALAAAGTPRTQVS